MRDATKVPPRKTCAKTVIASTTQATNHARRCPRRMPRAIMIIAIPATAVNAAADCATPSGKNRLDVVESTAQWRCRGDDDVDQTVEEKQSARPASNGSLAALLLQSFDGDREGVAGRPRSDRRRRAPMGPVARRCVAMRLFEQPFS